MCFEKIASAFSAAASARCAAASVRAAAASARLAASSARVALFSALFEHPTDSVLTSSIAARLAPNDLILMPLTSLTGPQNGEVGEVRGLVAQMLRHSKPAEREKSL